ncbi:metallophosphoesterase [uncultured Anaerococcus sp.]|uniref:metallophosphoesterase family protein n=1 Tax=uncultured Anaerococcus sp. TaxID=293428 RepID=UPI0025FC9289|nr:metallophosphoesterase [uncultured Anaerococcus sp.]
MQNKYINNFDISIISDPHILDGSLIKNSDKLKNELKVERKLVVESEALFKKALSMVDDASSKFLIIPGDITKEGELVSHNKAGCLLKKWKEKDPQRKIFLIPGNHDINSKRAYDFKKDQMTSPTSPKDFLNEYDFIYEDDSVLELYKDSDIFKKYLAEVNDKYERDKAHSYYANGYFSYVARIKKDYKYKNGLTLIMIDSSIYSADREQNNKDGVNNVIGSVSKEQLRWIVDKIDQAKERNDMVVAVAHHAFIPNFRNQELVFSPFIIKEYKDKIEDSDQRLDGKTPIEVLADNGIKFLFTGHLHENGTAKFISEKGNEIYDIQTGSTITYPLPLRHIRIDNKMGTISGFEIIIKTELIRDFTYTDQDKNKVVVDDAILHTLKNQLSLREVVSNYIRIQANNPKLSDLNLKKEVIDLLNSKLDLTIPYEGYMDQVIFPIIKYKFPMRKPLIGTIDLMEKNESYHILVKAVGNRVRVYSKDIEKSLDLIFRQIEKDILYPPLMIYFIEKILNKIFKMPIDDEGHNFYDFSNFIYQYRSNDVKRPKYVKEMIDNLNDQDYNIIDTLIDYATDEINEAFDYITKNIKFIKYGSKKRFFDDLIKTQGISSNLAYKYLRTRVDNLRDLLDFFSRFITRKSHITGVDLTKEIAHSRMVNRFKMDMSDRMFGQRSLRKFITDMIGEMNEDMAKIYQNDNDNDMDYYFNYIEFHDSDN